MKTISQMSQIELAAYVQTQLKQHGIDVVLTGGAAVSYYAGDQYVSEDIDLVAQWMPSKVKIRKAMEEIGFSEKARYYAHPEAKDIVEILPGPPAIGGQPIGETINVELQTGLLQIISPTDCAKDRLAAYFHWRDTESLLQAVMVSRSNELDMDGLSEWAAGEGKELEFQAFLTQLQS